MTQEKFLLLYAVFLLTLTACLAPAETTTSIPTTTISDSPTPTQPIPTTVEITVTMPTQDRYTELRQMMVDSTIEGRGIVNQDVIRAMRTVPRHLFVPEKYINSAYADHPLPIGYGQTISQPYIVAMMTELLELKPGDKVLEIGTGSGYQAAVLAELGYVDVYSIEIIPELAVQAGITLKKAGYPGIMLKQGDGYYGWEKYAPFNAIIVTAAPDHLPSPLVDQLTKDGRIVIPIGPPGGWQTLWQFVVEDGELVGYNLGYVSFVPFTREDSPLTLTP
ncbi:MAG: protein-L-isoaspartate(D-aspartate) O-methyltransferase [Anaerolineales bacterium]|nr:protein-L-isoaspartate(D-aspartate) O-methyltransferase [Anaerolineales bacterium]